jgi:hypothetical protein
MDPDTGAVLPGYPLTITAHGQPVRKTGALAADEAVDARCDDGDPCTIDCCADSLAGCSHTAIPNCGPEDCNNCIDDDLDGRTDLEDADCCAQAVSMRAMRSRLLAGKRAASKAQLRLRSAFAIFDFNPLADAVHVQLRGGSELLCAVLPNRQWRKRPLNRFVFRGGNGSRTDGLTGAVIRARPNHEVRFRMAGAPTDVTRYAQPELNLTLGIGTRCASGTLQLRQQKTSVTTYRSR